jgi:hypothetical protein
MTNDKQTERVLCQQPGFPVAFITKIIIRIMDGGKPDLSKAR